MITPFDVNNPDISCQNCGSESFETIEPDECNDVGLSIGDDGFQAVLTCSACETENCFHYVLVSVAS